MNRSSKSVWRWTSLVLVLAALLFIPSGIQPIPLAAKVSVISLSANDEVLAVIGSETIAADSFGAERVYCPTGMVAVNGGVDLGNVLTMVVSESGPIFDVSGNQRLIAQPDGLNPAPVGWQGSAINETDSPRLIKVAAICVRDLEAETWVSSATGGADSFGVERVNCPADKVAWGGGVSPQNVLTMQITSSGPVFPPGERLYGQPPGDLGSPSGWQASARNNASASQNLKVAAICGPPRDMVTRVASENASAGSFDVERVLCPQDMVAIGGGIDLQNVKTMKVTSSAPSFEGRLLSEPDGTAKNLTGWQASARNESTTQRDFRIAAICVKPMQYVHLPLVLRTHPLVIIPPPGPPILGE